MKSRSFVFDFVNKLYYKLHKIIFNCVGLYINCRKWLKDIFNYLNRTSNNLKSFPDQYAWKMINFHTGQKNWKNCEQNNPEVALNIDYIIHIQYAENLEINQAFTSET